MSGLTPKLPLALDDEGGKYLLIKNYKDLVKQNFKNLILTAPGERIMDPQFGVGILNFLFENAGAELEASIINRINEQVSRYMPFIGIIDIRAEESLDFNNFLSVRIEYAIGPLNTSDSLSITLPRN